MITKRIIRSMLSSTVDGRLENNPWKTHALGCDQCGQSVHACTRSNAELEAIHQANAFYF